MGGIATMIRELMEARMRRPITERERELAQIEIDVRMRMVDMGMLKALTARILDETNDDGEIVIEYDVEPWAPIECIVLGDADKNPPPALG